MDKEALAARGIRVKPLEFTRSAQYLSYGPYLGIWRKACTRYPVAGWEMRFRGHMSDWDLGTYDDPEKAISAANQHNETRILAALEVQDDK